MQSEKLELEELINKYLEGNCSLEEERLLLSWTNQLDLSRDIIINEDAGYLLKRKIDEANGVTKRAKLVSLFLPLRNVAASILIFATFGLAWYVTDRYYGQKELVHHTISHVKVLVHFEKVTNTGDVANSIQLEDGSKVSLQPNSSIVWQVPFSKLTRKVELSGRAFFQIAKNREKPFIVYAGNITTTALGTSFWVNERHKKGEVQVQLITGKVVIKQLNGRRINTLAYLTPGQLLTYKLSDHSATVINIPKNGVKETLLKPIVPPLLIFENESLNGVFARLQSYYHVKIVYDAKRVGAMTFYGTYSEKDEVNTILNTIAAANGLRVRKLNTTFIISD